MLANGIVIMTKEPPGHIIKRIRLEDLSRSQERFGDQIGVSRGTIANWENGASMPDAVNLAKILQVARPEYAAALVEALAELDNDPSLDPSDSV